MNILLIVIDTLRADHLGCYGYPKHTSPNIDKLAAEGVLFNRCYAPGIPTTPAHTTIFTGRHPLSHGIVSHGGTVNLDKQIPVLPELLQKAGYTTCAVDNLYDMKPWFARGFEYYINPSHRHLMRLLVSHEEINARAIPWLQNHQDEPFFMFVHYWEPHTPYMPSSKHQLFYDGRDPYDPKILDLNPMRKTPFWGMWGDTWFKKLGPVTDPDYIVSLYDGEIHSVDTGIGNLLGALDTLGLANDTLVILAADHGEVMVRNGIYFDHHGLYEENVRVPLIMRLPQSIPAGIVVNSMVQHTDIAPTVLKWIGVELPKGLDGKDIGELATGQADVGGWSETLMCENTWQKKWALRYENFKVIVSREPDHYGNPMTEIYDLTADPYELVNIARTGEPMTIELEERLESCVQAGITRAGRKTDPLIDQPVTLGQRWNVWRSKAENIKN